MKYEVTFQPLVHLYVNIEIGNPQLSAASIYDYAYAYAYMHNLL